jgi:hypothetical protein
MIFYSLVAIIGDNRGTGNSAFRFSFTDQRTGVDFRVRRLLLKIRKPQDGFLEKYY